MVNSGPALGPLAPRPVLVLREETALCLAGHCSQPVSGLHVVSFALPFSVIPFAGSARDSFPKALSGGTPDLGRLNSDSQRVRARRGYLELGRFPKQFLASGVYPGG